MVDCLATEENLAVMAMFSALYLLCHLLYAQHTAPWDVLLHKLMCVATKTTFFKREELGATVIL